MAKATKERKAAGVGSEVVAKKTGKIWAQWLRCLDGKGADQPRRAGRSVDTNSRMAFPAFAR